MIFLVVIVFMSLFFIKGLTKEIMSPDRLFLLIWSFALFVYLLNINRYIQYYSCFLLVIIIGSISFLVGEKLSSIVDKKIKFRRNIRRTIKITRINLLVLISILLTIGVVLKGVSIASAIPYSASLMKKIRLGINYLDYSYGLFAYTGNFINVLFMFCYLKYDELGKYRKLKIIILGGCSLITAIFYTGRGFLFNIVFSFLGVTFFKLYLQGKVRDFYKILLVAIIILVSSFSFYSIILEKDIDSNSSIENKINASLDSLSIYVSASLQALDSFLNQDYELTYGDNTLRTLKAIGYKIGITDAPSSLVDAYIDADISVNTYTVYKDYIEDFGVFGSFLYQFFFGFVHGIVFRLAKKRIDAAIIFSAFLIFPLIMQIMLDQYFSLLSNWIQIIFFILLFTKTSFILNKKG